MNREFLNLYEIELRILKEQASEFAVEFPGIADRLGGLLGDQMDPMIKGLLEGSAFLAARVQLKLKHEFPEFTANLLEQLVPNYLAPTPSVMLAKVVPVFGDPALKEGKSIRRNAYLDATYRERDRRVACRFRLTNDIQIWPLELREAEYIPNVAPLHALGLHPKPETQAGLKLSFTVRSAARIEDEPPQDVIQGKPDTWASAIRMDHLPLYLGGAEGDADAIYEQLFADLTSVSIRYLDHFGDPVSFDLPVDSIRQIGFEEGDAFFYNDTRVFEGFDFLREYFTFPRKFLGLRILGLGAALRRVPQRAFDIVFGFNESNARLAGAVKPESFLLYASPAINLFEMSTDRIPVKVNQHEYQVIPDRSRMLDYEPHRVLEVFAHYPGGRAKQVVTPLYSARADASSSNGLYFSIRRLPRRQSQAEKAAGSTSDYTGTDMFISLVEPADLDADEGVSELGVRALCSNRHLTEQLPVGEGGADFRLLEDTTIDFRCALGPTPPREPLLNQQKGRTEATPGGASTWRLINILSLNHLGLLDRGGGRNAQALRELLSLFADLADSATERRIRAVRAVEAKPIVRRVRHRAGTGAARGTEITVTLDEKGFEGGGAFLLGAVLDRFFAEYAAINHFTQLVVRSVERGEIKRWPPRVGARRVL
jgi:type VI secretion system protein ImpG